MFWRRREEPEPFYYNGYGPCMACGENISIEVPWFRDKQLVVKCKSCQTNQEIYPNRMAYTDTVINGRDNR